MPDYTRLPLDVPVRANDGSPTDARVILNHLSSGLDALEYGRINALDYGILFDARHILVNTVAGNPTVTLTGSRHDSLGADAIVAADGINHRAVEIDGAGPGGGWLRTTISSVIDSHTVVLNTAPSVTLTGGNGIVGTNNTAAINDLANHVVPGVVVEFPASEYDCLTDGDHHFVCPRFSMKGQGRYATRFVTTHNNDVFTVEWFNTAFQPHKPFVGGFSCYHGAYYSPTTGSTPHFPTGGNGLVESSYAYSGGKVLDVGFHGLYTGLGIGTGMTHVVGCTFDSTVYAGSTCVNGGFPDYGGFFYKECSFGFVDAAGFPTGGDGIQWQGGGGFEVEGCWFDGIGYMDNHIAMYASDGDTGNVKIIGNSFEDATQHSVLVDVSAGAVLSYGTIMGNVLQSSAPIEHFLLRGHSSSPYGIQGWSVLGNSGKINGGTLVGLDYADQVSVGPNALRGGSTKVRQSNSTNVTVI